jgi:predicted oxidoreductase
MSPKKFRDHLVKWLEGAERGGTVHTYMDGPVPSFDVDWPDGVGVTVQVTRMFREYRVMPTKPGRK